MPIWYRRKLQFHCTEDGDLPNMPDYGSDNTFGVEIIHLTITPHPLLQTISTISRNCLWCFIFVFHEEHRKYHEYPEYWVQCEILETKILISFLYRMKLCWKDGTVNISWLVEIFLTICCLITARLFWNVVTKSSQRQDGHCLKWNNF